MPGANGKALSAAAFSRSGVPPGLMPNLTPSFSAAYIAARLAGAAPVEAARAGHRLAGVVVCHPGAIIPRSAMPAITDIVPASSKA